MVILFTAFTIKNYSFEFNSIKPEQDISPMVPYHENPFYFSWQGEPVFLMGAAGFHSWTPISRPDNVDIEQQMNRLAKVIEEIGSPHIKGFVRCLPYDPWNHMHDGNVPTVLQPWQKTNDGRYDLTKINPSWEERLHKYLQTALKREIMVSLEVWDDWSITRGPEGQYDPGAKAGWNAHPFNPKNNINYDETALPTTTAACGAPFYSTISGKENKKNVLKLQQNYVDKLIAIADDYPNVIINIANESRADLDWSRYWAKYIHSRLPGDHMVGDMPSTNRRDGGGQCQQYFGPLTISLDPHYDYVDVSQAISGHEFSEITGQVIGGAHRLYTYRQSMKLKNREKPLVVSKDYTRDKQGGRMVLWSRFFGGAASCRFHRPAGDHGQDVIDFQHEAVKNLGKFASQLRFWEMKPAPEMIQSLPGNAKANVLAEENGHIVMQLIDGEQGDNISLKVPEGKWEFTWLDPNNLDQLKKGNIQAEKGATTIEIPVSKKHQILHLKQ